MAGPVLVTGATGDVGGEVVRLLVAAGTEVHALHRRPEQASALAELGAEPVLGRLDDASDLRRLMSGVDRLFLLTPPIAQQVDLERTVITAAQTTHLRHVVRISAGDSNPRSPVPWARAHAWGDRRLAATDLDWTSVRPSAFMQNLVGQAEVIRRGLLPHTAGGGGVGWIDTRDVAAVAARVLLDGPEAHRRATYFLTGPESLTFADVAARLTAGLGRRVRAVALPKPAYVALLRAAGLDAFMAHGLGAQFADVVRHNVDIDTTWDVERLTGNAPRSMAGWVEEHHDLF
ncbi:SDR family oxidoreductase [Microlunatus spumicola]|uniref:SDR family oxidoreductase n=1 Tax=Microlunatus spumicola TaxID=81499 RepID=A0ABP6X2B5_9ACTN